ncbi:MAG: sigma54 specific transcriptional regulator, Fis family [Myxococcales bacterium]|nr:sigma54 specific transcriptional regulator, Fis family [Myxococcales bacterium]
MANPPGHGLYEDSPALTTVFDGARATVRHLRKSKVVVVSGAEQGREVDVGKPRVTGGRSIINDLVLSDKAISGSHFEILARDDGYRLRDLDSTNGTFVGELRIREVWLKPGQEFRVGHTLLRFVPMQDIVEIPLSKRDTFESVTGASVKMREIFATLEKVAPSELTVLVTGETGTGKEMIARGIHQASTRKSKPFVVLDCGAIPKDLIESTLFGHENGSFTGAVAQHQGCFEQAHGGTIFLDEIGELDVNLQPKLLRVLENRELKRVGGDRVIKIDVRVVAATNRDLRMMVNNSTFREDLYFRLSVIHVEMPGLRERKEDIPALAEVFLREIGTRRNMSMTFASDALATLQTHSWPGNVRELKNVVERAASLTEGSVVTRQDLMFNRDNSSRMTPSAPSTGHHRGGAAVDVPAIAPGLDFKEAKQQIVDAFELAYLKQLLERHEGNITRSAQEAGLTRYHLRELLKRHGLTNVKE